MAYSRADGEEEAQNDAQELVAVLETGISGDLEGNIHV
jgi:hypothetical protein